MLDRMPPVFDAQKQPPIRANNGTWTPPAGPPAVPRQPTERDRRLRDDARALVAKYGSDAVLLAIEVHALVDAYGVSDVRRAVVAAGDHHNGKGA